MADNYAGLGMPGPSAVSITNERSFLLGPITWYLLKGVVLKSTASDAGNTPTTQARAGLLLGKITATGLYEHYQPNATTGVQVAEGVLFEARNTLDSDGTAVNRPAQMVIAGYAKASQLLLLDEQARRQMQGRFVMDDRPTPPFGGYTQTLAKTADYTVVTGTDNNTHFTTTGAAGAVNFTLPAVGATAKGNRFRFTNTVGQNMTITAPAGKLVTFNNAAATSVAFSTAGNKIGATVEIVADETGAFWLAIPSGANTMTVA